MSTYILQKDYSTPFEFCKKGATLTQDESWGDNYFILKEGGGSVRIRGQFVRNNPEWFKKKEGWSHSIFPGQFIAENIELVIKIIYLKAEKNIFIKDQKFEAAANALDEEMKLIASVPPVFMVMLEDLLKKHLSDYTKNTPDAFITPHFGSSIDVDWLNKVRAKTYSDWIVCIDGVKISVPKEVSPSYVSKIKIIDKGVVPDIQPENYPQWAVDIIKSLSKQERLKLIEEDPSLKEIVGSLCDNELKIIKASEAKQISELQSSKDSEFNKTMSDIEQQARNGKKSISFFMLYDEIIIDKLRQLGYVVTTEGPFSTWVNWDNPTV